MLVEMSIISQRLDVNAPGLPEKLKKKYYFCYIFTLLLSLKPTLYGQQKSKLLSISLNNSKL